MDLIKIVAELQTERDRIDQAITFLERVTVGAKRRGRPASLAGLTKRGIRAVALLKTLSARDEKVIRLRFGIRWQREPTLEEIGRELNLTRQRIFQIEARALRRLGSL
jgi:DNA-directed RNA polymerase sigma subunit (sigma70/sigma32)